jgi:tRNA threonylcarbamoyladenosine biosynthesis protein TsaB
MLLAIDTATATASVALYDPVAKVLLVEQTWQSRRRHTQDLLAETQHLLQLSGLTPQDLTALAVTTGPGSFTGVRVGISTVKGLLLGMPEPPRVVGVPTLTVTAAPWLDAAFSITPWPIVCAVIHAGRGRFNWCFFGPEDLLHRPSAHEHHAGTAAELAGALEEHGADSKWLVGETDAELLQALETIPSVTAIDAVSGLRRAGQLARLATLLIAERVEDDAASLQPLYLRAP